VVRGWCNYSKMMTHWRCWYRCISAYKQLPRLSILNILDDKINSCLYNAATVNTYTNTNTNTDINTNTTTNTIISVSTFISNITTTTVTVCLKV